MIFVLRRHWGAHVHRKNNNIWIHEWTVLANSLNIRKIEIVLSGVFNCVIVQSIIDFTHYILLLHIMIILYVIKCN